jgi:hypothetical protein
VAKLLEYFLELCAGIFKKIDGGKEPSMNRVVLSARQAGYKGWLN